MKRMKEDHFAGFLFALKTLQPSQTRVQLKLQIVDIRTQIDRG
jgi:hypothetical protein